MTETNTKTSPPIVLIILDGFGETEEIEHNAIKLADTPTLDHLLTHYPHTLLNASGEAVGLPKGQMGNSEVGHLHIGAGRKVPQDLTRIDDAIATGEFYKNTVLIEAIKKARANDKAVHIIGLLSPGGVHSHEDQIAAMIELVHREQVTKNFLHAILDGRDTPPKSALSSIEKIDQQYKNYGCGKIASLIGRYYAMDRDNRWERTQKAYDLLTQGLAQYKAATAQDGLALAYKHGETDEFIAPISVHHDDESPIIIEDNDVVIFMNFRADRARQLTHALIDTNFSAFNRHKIPHIACLVTLTSYAKDIDTLVAFPPLHLKNTLGEYLSALNLRQLRIAETEKYAHVTYFLNGGQETPFPLEERVLIPSPKVTTYDLKPEMSAIEMTDQLIDLIKTENFNLIVCNFANPDMVGHTGDEEATRSAIHTIDTCIQRIITELKSIGGEALITADHGNAEKMFDKETNQPHTAHTNNLVPLIYVGRQAEFIKEKGALDDVAPTLLYLMGLKPPHEMTGRNLIILK